MSSPCGTAAATVTSIGRPLPVARPVAVTRPDSRGSSRREVGERRVEADVGARARDRAVRGEGDLGVVDPQVLGADAGLVAHRPSGDGGGAGEERVGARVADGDVGDAALEGEVEAAAERGDAAVGLEVDGARERPVGDAGEDGDVGDA